MLVFVTILCALFLLLLARMTDIGELRDRVVSLENKLRALDAERASSEAKATDARGGTDAESRSDGNLSSDAEQSELQDGELQDEDAAERSSDAKRSAHEDSAVARLSPPTRDAPQTPAPRTPPAPPPLAAQTNTIDLERFLGIRGAAILGGIALVLAGIFFLRYAIEHGYFGPGMRVASASAIGALCVGSRGTLRRRGYPITAQALAGAGIALLYGAAWAGYRLYELLPFSVALPWMIAVTALTCVISLRDDSEMTASFGLIGGFLTPLLLEAGLDEELFLFGYILCLDVGLLALALLRSWNWLAGLALVCTSAWQSIWVFAHATPDDASFGFCVLAAFALLFAGFARAKKTGSEYLALGWPLVLATRLAYLVPHDFVLAPTGVFLVLLLAAAGVLERDRRNPMLSLLAAVACVPPLFAWLIRQSVVQHPQQASSPVDWPLALTLALLFATCLAFAWRPPHALPRRALPSIALCTFTSFLLLGATSTQLAVLPAFFFAVTVVFACTSYIAVIHARPQLVPLACLTAGFLVLVAIDQEQRAGTTDARIFAHSGALLLAAFCLLGLAWRNRERNSARWLAGGVAPLVLPSLFALQSSDVPGSPALCVALVVLATVGSCASGFELAFVATASVAIGITYPTLGGELVLDAPAAQLGVQAALAALLTWTPHSRRQRLSTPFTIAACLVPLAFFTPDVVATWKQGFGHTGIAAIPLTLAAIAGVGALLARRDARLPGVAIALLLLAFALPFEVETDWFLLGGMLTGAAWAKLGRSTTTVLSWAGAISLVAAGGYLSIRFLMPGTYASSPALLWNEFGYVHAVAIASLLAGAWWARDRVSRELVVVALCGCAFLGFAWMNLVILNSYETETTIRLLPERLEARDLLQSLFWTLYAFALLAIGLLAKQVALRWASLAFLVLAILKVFLHDLSGLSGLYRVASMAALAICLLLVSLLYQRFVFGSERAAAR